MKDSIAMKSRMLEITSFELEQDLSDFARGNNRGNPVPVDSPSLRLIGTLNNRARI